MLQEEITIDKRIEYVSIYLDLLFYMRITGFQFIFFMSEVSI